MKKTILILSIALALVISASLAVATYAFAQDENPDTPVCPYCGEQGPGNPDGRRGGFRGQAEEGVYGPMHDYLSTAYAEALGITPAELDELHQSGKTLWDAAQEQGLTFEEFQTIMEAARMDALNRMVADGVISQEQADWMSQRMGNRGGNYGTGDCSGLGLSQGGRGPGSRGGGRWINQP